MSLVFVLCVFLQKLKSEGKGAVFIGASFIYGLLGSAALLPKLGELEAFLQKVEIDSAEEDRIKKAKKAGLANKDEQKSKEAADGAASSSSAAAPAAAASSVPAASAAPAKKKQLVRTKDTVSISSKDKSGKKVTEKVTGLCEFTVFDYQGHQSKVMEWFKQQGFAINE